MKNLGEKTTPYRYLAPTIIVLIVFMVVPIIMVIGYSFMDNAVVSPNPGFAGLENYETLFSDSDYFSSITNTLIFVVISVVAHLLIGLLFASLLNSDYFSTGVKTLARVVYILPWVFTASVVAILWNLMLQPSGVINYILDFLPNISRQSEWLSDRTLALWVVCFINIWCGYPFYMISILAGLQGIPGSLYESATIDGAGATKSFLHITIPQLRPILISIAMLDFIWTLQSFNVIWMLTGGGPVNSTQTLSVYIYKLAFQRVDYSLASAAAVVLLVACIIIAVFYVRQQQKASE